MKKIAYMLLALILCMTVMPVHKAEASYLKTVRVALFMDEPGLYSNKTSYATLGSKSNLNLKLNQAQLLTYNANAQLKVGLNDYKVKVMESTSFESVNKAYQSLKAAGGSASIISMQKNDTLVYQLVEGSYATEALAKAALEKWKKSLSSLISGVPSISGPFALTEGMYSTKNDALMAASKYGKQGLDTAVALQVDSSGKAYYSAVIGMVSSQAELDLIKIVASTLGGQFNSLSGSEQLIIIRHDHALTNHSGTFNDLVLFNGGQHKLVVTAAEDGTVNLTERANRSYRGSLEFGRHNNQFYVINELSVEQYLYSVVAVEMYTSWPLEALKAQAVASRTFVAQKGMQFKIAHVVDTTLSQAYYGADSETENTRKAVDQTRGEIILYNGKAIDAVYSSNAGGNTAKASEVWRNDLPYLQTVPSNDTLAEEGLLDWYKIVLNDGKVGYMRSDYLKDTGQKNEAGLAIYQVTGDKVAVRKHPLVQATVNQIAELTKGTQVTYIGKHVQSNAYRWLRGPYTSNELLAAINKQLGSNYSQPILKLEVASRGESGRALSIKMNNEILKLSSPDSIRSLFNVDGSLPSTKLDIEASGSVAILGANGQIRQKDDGSQSITIQSLSNQTTSSSPYVYVLNGAGDVRAVTKEASYTFTGTGFGHGVGMSQYGAYQLARAGYDYQSILKYYYTGVTIAKDE